MLAPFLKTLLHFESVPMVSTIESLAKAHELEVHELESHTDKSAVKISKAFDIIECKADRGSSVRRASDTLADTFKVAAFLVLAIVVRNTFTNEATSHIEGVSDQPIPSQIDAARSPDLIDLSTAGFDSAE
jgi:hypothetical protein